MAKNYHLQPSEIDRLQYYEWETYLEEVNVLEKKYSEEQEKQNEEYSAMKKQFSPNSFNSQMSQMQRSMASTTFGSGNFKMPTISVPKFK